MTRSTRLCVASTLALGLLLDARSARATPTFPDVVASHLELGAPPSCTLCHAGTPARGTVTTPFGATLMTRGAAAYDEDALRLALDALADEEKDSDGDGVSDIDELRSGADPNAGAGGQVIAPEYGCRASRGRDAGAGATSLALAALALGALLRRPARGRFDLTPVLRPPPSAPWADRLLRSSVVRAKSRSARGSWRARR